MKKIKRKEKPGPKPEMLKIKGDWRDAVKKSFDKKKSDNCSKIGKGCPKRELPTCLPLLWCWLPEGPKRDALRIEQSQPGYIFPNHRKVLEP